MITWEATVKIKGVPTPMQFKAQSAFHARQYFQTFGEVISDIRIVS